MAKSKKKSVKVTKKMMMVDKEMPESKMMKKSEMKKMGWGKEAKKAKY